jgi:hypothetical protein
MQSLFSVAYRRSITFHQSHSVMKRFLPALLIVYFCISLHAQSPLIIDHDCTYLNKIPANWVDSARSKLHIAYGHTSHGSQLISGMEGIYSHYGDNYAFSNGGSEGSLDLHDYFASYSIDLGNPNFYKWDTLTREYLLKPANADVNVIIWSWCGELSYAEENHVNIYLDQMNQLEQDFPDKKFVYMTGHLDGKGPTGKLHLRNEQIRTFCRNNNKILFDFADIESYAPYGEVNYMELLATDNCDFDSDGDGSQDANWAVQWSTLHPDSCFYSGECAHSQSLNCQRKGIAAWWLWASLAGWNKPVIAIPVTGITVTGEGENSAITTKSGTLQLVVSVIPADASDKSVTWTIVNGTGQANINSSGLVTAVGNGSVTATATANDGSGISGSMVINITNQEIPDGLTSAGSLKPPVITVIHSELRISFHEFSLHRSIQLYNLHGELLFRQPAAADDQLALDISSLSAGFYILVISDDNDQSVFKVTKP